MSLLKKLLLAVFLFAVGMSVSAQERITVRGRVMGFDGNPLESVKIYAFSSYDIVDDECKRAEEELKSKGDSYAPLSTATEARTDERGDYELTVYPEGGLLFLAETPEKVCIHVEYVENRREINPEIDNRVEIDGSGIINDALPEIPQPDAISIGDIRLFSNSLNRMIDTMRKAGGVGLAAQQVGRLERVCVIDVPEGCDEGADAAFNAPVRMPLVMFNPLIIAKEGAVKGGEGCLSFPKIGGSVVRAEQVAVSYLNLDNMPQAVTVRGFLARAVQHEVDHLDGILYIDRMTADERLSHSKPLERLAKANGAAR